MQTGHGRILATALVAFLGASLLTPRPAPGSPVAEQRARLPPMARCDDPVVGVWKSHNYNDVYGQWTEFTLEIRRVADTPGRLEGRILNHSWHGPVSQVQPPDRCTGDLRYEVSMDALGTASGLEVEFWGVGQWRLDRVLCGDAFGFGYNLDHFSGVIDPAIQEFQSVNNDGGISINEPTVFRRIRCFEGSAPAVEVEPPPFHPPARGCGGW